MIKNDKKRAYTLAEIMIVVLILTVIFAAFAPLFTGRTIKNYKSKYNVWEYANYSNYDAMAYTGKTNSDQAFFGVSPADQSDVKSTLMPQATVVVRAGDVTGNQKMQRHFQFRYGRESVDKPGMFAGTWFVNGKNMLLGGSYQDLSATAADAGVNNVGIGYGALTNITSARQNTAFGYNALSQATDSTSNNNVAIGYLALAYNKGLGNTAIGYGANANGGSRNVAVGYRAALGMDETSEKNVAIGTKALESYYSSSGSGSTKRNNVAIGYEALMKLNGGENNVAIGAGALINLENGNNNVAIGYHACEEVLGSNKTCIGYMAGPHRYARQGHEAYGTLPDAGGKYSSTAAFLGGLTDNAQRTYIGSQPYHFGGDAVLEIHNMASGRGNVGDSQTSTFNVTTVINGNLIVRGRPYFTVGRTLHHFSDGGNSSAGADHGLLVSKSTKSGESTVPTGEEYSTGWSYYGKGVGDDYYYAQCSADSYSYKFDISDNSKKCINLITNPIYTPSDRRLKNIESKFTGGLEQLRNIKVYNYTFKNDKKKLPHVGVIAQELQKVFPNSVFKGEDGYLRISWHEMFYAVINGIKELDKRIIALITRTDKAEAQITKLEKENNELKVQVDNLAARINKLKAE